MLVSSVAMLKAFEKLPASGTKDSLIAWFTRLVTVQEPTRPEVKLIEEEKTVVLYCNDALWDTVNKWRSKNIESMNFVDAIRIWKEIKPLLEKENKS